MLGGAMRTDKMRRQLLDILACPKCKTYPFELKVIQEEGIEVVTGELTCPKCKTQYPIEDAIPNLLVPEDR